MAISHPRGTDADKNSRAICRYLEGRLPAVTTESSSVPGLQAIHVSFFSSRLRARSRIFLSFAVKLPMPDLEILSRIGSTDA